MNRHIHVYTASLQHEDCEDLFWQQMYIAMDKAGAMINYNDLVWHAYSRIGMVRGVRIVITSIIIDF